MKFRRIRESLLMRALAAAGVSALLTLAILASTATPASAYEPIGVRYDPNSINPIQYRFFGVNSLSVTAFKQAEATWDATSVPGYFAESTWSLDPEINVIDEAEGYGYYARCTGTDSNEDGLWDGNEVTICFNTDTIGSLTASQKKIIAMHELGHAYGLDELTSGCHVMWADPYIFSCGTLPSSDDIAGVNAIY